MKKIFIFLIAIANASLQGALYTEQQLQTIEAVSALANTATTILYAIPPEVDSSVFRVKELSANINKLMAYALLDKSPMMHFSTVLNTVAENESWHLAPRCDAEFMQMFAREFAVALGRGVGSELLWLAKNKIITWALGENADRRMLRVAQLIASTLTTTFNQALFNYLDTNINKKYVETDIPTIFAQTFFNELGWHLAGFVIAECTDGNRNDFIPTMFSLNDVK